MKKLVIAGLIGGMLSGCSIDETPLLSYKCSGEWRDGTCPGNLVVKDEFKIKVKNGIITKYNPKTGTAIYRKDCTVLDAENWQCDHDYKNNDGIVYAFEVEQMNYGRYRYSFGFSTIDLPGEVVYGLSGWKYYAYKLGVGLEKLHYE